MKKQNGILGVVAIATITTIGIVTTVGGFILVKKAIKKQQDLKEEQDDKDELFRPEIQASLELMKKSTTDPIRLAALAVLTTEDDSKVVDLPELEAIKEEDPELQKLVMEIRRIRKGLGLSYYRD